MNPGMAMVIVTLYGVHAAVPPLVADSGFQVGIWANSAPAPAPAMVTLHTILGHTVVVRRAGEFVEIRFLQAFDRKESHEWGHH